MSNRLADGSSGGGRRMEAACVRAIDACIRLDRQLDDAIEQLDGLTAPGVVRSVVDDEDSLVLALQIAGKRRP